MPFINQAIKEQFSRDVRWFTIEYCTLEHKRKHTVAHSAKKASMKQSLEWAKIVGGANSPNLNVMPKIRFPWYSFMSIYVTKYVKQKSCNVTQKMIFIIIVTKFLAARKISGYNCWWQNYNAQNTAW